MFTGSVQLIKVLALKKDLSFLKQNSGASFEEIGGCLFCLTTDFVDGDMKSPDVPHACFITHFRNLVYVATCVKDLLSVNLRFSAQTMSFSLF